MINTKSVMLKNKTKLWQTNKKITNWFKIKIKLCTIYDRLFNNNGVPMSTSWHWQDI